MYEGDTPNAERRAAALALDRDLLRELLGQEELRELIDPEALDEVEARSSTAPSWPGQGPRRPPADPAPARRPDRRGVRGARAEGYSASRCWRSSSASAAPRGPDRRRGALDRRRGRRPLPRRARRPPPPGLPDAFLERGRGRDGSLVRRYARTHGPFPTAPARRRYGVDPMPACASSSAPASSSAASSSRRHRARVVRRRRPAPRPPRQPRRTCARRPRPSTRRELARFLPGWQNVDAHRPAGAGPDRLREALVPLQGVALTPEVWERDVLPRRLGAYSPAWLDQLCTSGEIVWIGAGALGAHRPGRPLLPRGRPPRRPAAGERQARAPEGEVHDAIRERLAHAPSLLDRPGRRARLRAARSSTRRSGTSPGRRGDQRRLRAPARPRLSAVGSDAAGRGASLSRRRRRAPASRAAGR